MLLPYLQSTADAPEAQYAYAILCTMKHTPSTVIVDTHVLTDGTLDLIGYAAFGSSTRENCEETARRALMKATSHLAESLRKAIGVNTFAPSHPPIANNQTTIIRTLWHHGEQYMSYCIGPISEITRLCDLTDNERESLAVEGNRLGGEGKIAFGLASGSTSMLIERTSQYDTSLTFAGMLICEPRLFPGAIGAIERLQEKGTRVVYISRDNAAVVSAVAHAAHISADTVYSAKLAMHTNEMQIIANVPSKDYATFIEGYLPGAYVVRHEITELR